MAASGNNATRVVARELSLQEYEEWSALVTASEQGSVYSLPEYLGPLCRATDAEFRVLGAFLDGRLVGGVALFERASRWGRYVGNRLLLYYNGVVLNLPPKKFPSDATSQRVAVLGALAAAIESQGYAQVQLHNRSTLDDLRPFLSRGWEARLSYTYVMPLSDVGGAWERVDPNLKRLIGRCEREGVTYREDDDFDSLLRLHLQTHERKGAPLYLPGPIFQRYFRELHGQGLARLGHAVFDGKVIASQLMLTPQHRVAHTVCAGADEAYLKMGASAFLRWHACLALARDGYEANDLTDAALNSVSRFKSQLGAQLTATLSIARTDSRAFGLASTIRQWRDERRKRATEDPA